jgi:hypothetical protein
VHEYQFRVPGFLVSSESKAWYQKGAPLPPLVLAA